VGVTGEPPGFPEFFAILRRSRTLIFATLVFSLMLGIALALALPSRYRAVAILLPPDERGLPPLTRTERESLAADPGGPAPLEVLETPAGLAARLLHTRPVIDLAMKRLAPPGGWSDVAAEAAARKDLEQGLQARVTDEKIVLVEVESESAEFAARSANAMGAAIDEFNVRRRRELAASLANSLEGEIAAQRESLGGLSEEGDAERVVREATLAALAAEFARARQDEIDPRPAIEFVERASVPDRPSEPLRAAVVACVVFAGLLGGVAGAFIRHAAGPRKPLLARKQA
jgi:uncharacterized protein involved in exopolysaccharide biosynthesis